ncbi:MULTISPECIES: preprotein translocase subunit SecE [Actinomyces]|uniref:Protein translocase subunit SecE n=1 Tax=Actinomyces respiraculi TaxID=2744574 RepID=A0A7T0LKC7_9ACTO|nr:MULTISPECIES: preprotein translocase subunit SecE [Actinomyces]QPL05036.1 preprotein translocase subunit SecE [Actinomyces respiraculi]
MSEGNAVAKGKQNTRTSLIGRVPRFLREVVDELRKVVWPTSKELWTYFTVVVVFIVAIMAFTGVLDLVFDRLVMWLFA